MDILKTLTEKCHDQIMNDSPDPDDPVWAGRLMKALEKYQSDIRAAIQVGEQR